VKRFTETSKWGDPWYRKLSPQAKLLWAWLTDNCDHAGIIEPDLELATFQIGYAMGMDTLSELGERLTMLECGKWLIVKFIPFQYGELSRDCKAHNPVFASLEKHGLKGYPKGIHTPQRGDQDTDKDKDKDKKGDERGRPTLEEVKFTCSKSGIIESDAVWFWNKCEGNGWTNNGKPIKSYPHTLAAWKAAGYLPSQKSNGKTEQVGGRF